MVLARSQILTRNCDNNVIMIKLSFLSFSSAMRIILNTSVLNNLWCFEIVVLIRAKFKNIYCVQLNPNTPHNFIDFCRIALFESLPLCIIFQSNV